MHRICRWQFVRLLNTSLRTRNIGFMCCTAVWGEKPSHCCRKWRLRAYAFKLLIWRSGLRIVRFMCAVILRKKCIIVFGYRRFLKNMKRFCIWIAMFWRRLTWRKCLWRIWRETISEPVQIFILLRCRAIYAINYGVRRRAISTAAYWCSIFRCG